MCSLKYFIFSLIWIFLYNENIKDNSFLMNHNKREYNVPNGRILRLDTPEPWGDSETYEVVTKDKHGNLITTVFNKNAEALYFYINKKKPKEKNSSKAKNSKMRKKGKNN
ncbi:hypothetical protein PGSY75_0725400 [Plasmodium gaboni]|uniref:Uncharacterized protein n=1 Tax=Plasmodium gaboni TaxID=647221 RepID=A0A151LQD9_9APIC|nr:hypothetical protein PGSY75_0725400 [Plasmodium gaboni]KYO01392.1 hypothetical protein PGSY75_0725400 [Plasmodium gaboni]SOV13082.1 conserved Plasmodium protein, unknown function [Plasmodium gaboni]SOV22039.1 conserved Plasmodium protein, unknown function [Plasmodium sp. DRC-Itaito]